MADTKDYLQVYRRFFEEFAATVNPDDQLPVKVGGYYLCDSEIVGEIVDWTLQYLNQKQCPSSLVAPLTRIVIEEIKLACKKQPAACGYRSAENTYQPLKLMQVVTGKVNEVCLRYRDNGKLATLPPPTPGPPISSCAIKNTRRRMEDRHVIIEDFHTVFDIQDRSPASYYAVFDGHAGTDAAVYSVSHLHQFLAESSYYPTDPERALKDAFSRTDALFLEKSNRENLRSGTTAVCALLRPKEKMLYVAWLGDSQALLVREGQAVQVVNPHKPERKDERDRIENMGGCVLFWGTWRVNGQLAVSRAIGDLEYKPYVTAEPDVTAVPLNGTEDFLVLACDGLWDFVSEEEAVNAVYQQVHEAPGDLEAVSQRLVQLSKQQASTDNISVIVVFLTDPVQLASRSVPLPLDVPRSQWASLSNGPQESSSHTMETSFDHNTNDTSTGNNPFLMNPASNGPESVPYQKGGLLLDLNAGGDAELTYKQNGTSPSTTDLYFMDRPSNGKTTEGLDNFGDDDDDFGPETDVDAVDDVLLSPAIAATKAALLSASNNNPFGVSEFDDKEEKEHTSAIEADLELQRQQMSDFDLVKEPREETPTPPADEVPGVTSAVPESDNVAESGEDSEDEWNYFRVEPTAAGSDSAQQTTQKVCENPAQLQLEDDSDMESQLNPNAAEFVPSPTQTMPSMEDVLLAESPKKGIAMEDINVPSQVEFQQEASLRPSELDLANELPSFVQKKVAATLPDLINSEERGDTSNPFLPPGAICGKSIHHLNREVAELEKGDGDFQDQNGISVEQQGSNIGHTLDDSEASSTKAEFGDDSCFLGSVSELQKTINDSATFSSLDKSFVDQVLLEAEVVADATKSDIENTLDYNELSQLHINESFTKNFVTEENEEHVGQNLLDTPVEGVPMSFELCKELVPEMESKPERVVLESEGTSSFEQDDSYSPVLAEETKLESIVQAIIPQDKLPSEQPLPPASEEKPLLPEVEESASVQLATDLQFTMVDNDREILPEGKPLTPILSPVKEVPSTSPLWESASPIPGVADTASSTPETLPLEKDAQSPSPLLETKSPVCESPSPMEGAGLPMESPRSPVPEQDSSQLLDDGFICKESVELPKVPEESTLEKAAEIDVLNAFEQIHESVLPTVIEKLDDNQDALTCETLVEEIKTLSLDQEREPLPVSVDETVQLVSPVKEIATPPPTPAHVSDEQLQLSPPPQESQSVNDIIGLSTVLEDLSTTAVVVGTAGTVAAAVAVAAAVSSEEKPSVETKSPEKAAAVEAKKSTVSKEKKTPVAEKAKTSKTPTTTKSTAATAKLSQKSTPTSPTKPLTSSIRSSTPKKPSTPVPTATSKVTKSPATPTSKAKTGVTSPTKPTSTLTKAPAAASPRTRPSSSATTVTTTTTIKSSSLANGDVKTAAAVKKTTATKPPTRPLTAPTATKTAVTKQMTVTSKTTTTLSSAPPRPKPGAVNGISNKPRTTTTVTTASARNKVGPPRDTKLATEKQVKETANKQISSTRTVAAKSTTTTAVRSAMTTATRKVSGVTKTTTMTTTTVKSAMGKVGTKKTTTSTTSANRTTTSASPKTTKTAVTTENNELVQVQKISEAMG